MNKDRKILLIILFFSILVSASALNIFILNDKHKQVKNRISLVEQNLDKLELGSSVIPVEVINYLKTEISSERARYFEPENMDPFQFAIEIKLLLESKNITIKSYKSIEEDHIFFIEFTVAGQSVSFFHFLEELENKQMNYFIPRFSIKNEKDGFSSTFRIGYKIYE